MMHIAIVEAFVSDQEHRNLLSPSGKRNTSPDE